jgi:hypothetical protein
MQNEIRERLSKVYALVLQGATDGEKKAASAALDRLMKKYNITMEQLADLTERYYYFKYKTKLHIMLFRQIVKVILLKDHSHIYRDTDAKKSLIIKLNYEDYITLESSYEYFKRHMDAQFKKVCGPELAKCRKAKTRNARREELYGPFIQSYCIASKLYLPDELVTQTIKGDKKALDAANMRRQVEGGKYNKQMAGGLYIEDAK